MGDDNYFDLYREYVTPSEAPMWFHRWGAISSLATWLGRDVWFDHGHFQVYPNIYAMLIGTPGTRKSTAIKIAKNLLIQAGYQNIAAEKTSKEKFLFDLAAQSDPSLEMETTTEGGRGRKVKAILETNLWGEDDIESKPPAETYIAADEFNDFIGSGNLEFISLLGNLWDFIGVFKHRVKNGKSIAIPNPTINLFGGNTPVGFTACFPPETLGQGFLSRLLLVYGESTGVRITFPRPPSTELRNRLLSLLANIKQSVRGPLVLSASAESVLDKIYQSHQGMDDPRFASYSNRRFTHLLKLCIVCMAARVSRELEKRDVLLANTILSHTESMMPKALGEFGKSKHSDVSHKIMEILYTATSPITPKDLFGLTYQDVDSPQVLAQITGSLQVAGKIQMVNGGWLPRNEKILQHDSSLVDYSILHPNEWS